MWGNLIGEGWLGVHRMRVGEGWCSELVSSIEHTLPVEKVMILGAVSLLLNIVGSGYEGRGRAVLRGQTHYRERKVCGFGVGGLGGFVLVHNSALTLV